MCISDTSEPTEVVKMKKKRGGGWRVESSCSEKGYKGMNSKTEISGRDLCNIYSIETSILAQTLVC